MTQKGLLNFIDINSRNSVICDICGKSRTGGGGPGGHGRSKHSHVKCAKIRKQRYEESIRERD